MASRRVVLLSFTGLFLALAACGPLQAVDWTVDTTDDENDASCTPGDCSLREAIAAAGDGDTILFALPGGQPWTITLVEALGQLSLANDVTLTGPGLTQLEISGANLVRVMTVEAGATVHISDLKLRNGETKAIGDKHGGCLKVLGTVVATSTAFESCQAWNGGLTSNTTGGDGGGIYVETGGSLTGTLLYFSGDHAGNGGGATGVPVFAGGRGGGLANRGITFLTQTSVTGGRGGDGGGPTGAGGDGGGIANLAGGELRLDATTLYSNHSGDGATFNSSSGLDGRGGGLYCAGNCTLNNVTISTNGTGFSGFGAVSKGGGLAVVNGITRLRNVTVAFNVSLGAGGGIACTDVGAIETRNSIFSNNTGGFTNPDCTQTFSTCVTAGSWNVIRASNGCSTPFGGTDLEGTIAAPVATFLGAIGGNGGPTATHALDAGSPAIDRGDPLGCAGWNPVTMQDEIFTADQRGEPRPTDGNGNGEAICDAGAYEAAGQAPVQHLLTVTVAGAGAGDVTSVPAGIACPGDCSESWVATQNVQLTAAPAAGSYFVGWSGACSGTGACAFTMSVDRTVTATFGLLRALDVALAGAGSGAVTSVPAGIACPGDCTELYIPGTGVALTASPAPGSYFIGWGGDCSGSGACGLTMSADRAVTVTFGLLRTLSVTLAGAGSGSVASLPSGIACPADCNEAYPDGTPVTLTPTPAPGSFFSGWSVDCTGSGPCAPVLDADRSVTATFGSLAIFLDGFESNDPCAWSANVGGTSCPP